MRTVLQFLIIIRTWHNNGSCSVEFFFWYFHLCFSGLASKFLHLWGFKSFGVWHFAIWWVVHDVAMDPSKCWVELAWQRRCHFSDDLNLQQYHGANLKSHSSSVSVSQNCLLSLLTWLLCVTSPLFTPRHIRPMADLLCPLKQQPNCGSAMRVIKIIQRHHVIQHLASLLYLDHFMWQHAAQCYSTLPLFSFHAFWTNVLQLVFCFCSQYIRKVLKMFSFISQACVTSSTLTTRESFVSKITRQEVTGDSCQIK